MFALSTCPVENSQGDCWMLILPFHFISWLSSLWFVKAQKLMTIIDIQLQYQDEHCMMEDPSFIWQHEGSIAKWFKGPRLNAIDLMFSSPTLSSGWGVLVNSLLHSLAVFLNQ